MSTDDWRIRERGDAADIREAFKAEGWAQAFDFLEPEAVDAVAALIDAHADWRVTYNAGHDAYQATRDEWEAAGEAARAALVAQIHKRAQRGFQYLFEHMPVSEIVRKGEDAGPLGALHVWFNQPAFLGRLQEMTGVDLGARAHVDVYVTRYGPGHFLTDHDDAFSKADRHAAYVLNLTPTWRPDWGGQLALINERGDITRGLTPSFNTLNFFRVPQPHAVMPVAPYAGARRVSISGWLRGDGPV